MLGLLKAEISVWDLKRIKVFYKFVGVSCEGFEVDALQLFQALGAKWRSNGKSTEVKRSGGQRSWG